MASKSIRRSKVYGAIQRCIHAWIGVFVTALVTMGWSGMRLGPGQSKIALAHAHIFFGYGLILGLVARIIWGLLGPKHALFSALWHPRSWLQAIRTLSLQRQSAGFGHDKYASAVYLSLYAALAISAVSGMMLAAIKHNLGPLATSLFDDFSWYESIQFTHELILYLSTAFLVLHVGALIKHEEDSGHPVAQGMLSGYQYKHFSKEGKINE